MVTVSKPKKREIITRAPFVSDDIGEIVAYHDEEGPTIDVTIRPEDSGQYAQFGLTAAEVHELADELHRIANKVQRAGWTPTILTDARTYLPGMTDEQIIERLDRLYRRWGGLVIGFRGRLDRRAGRALAVEVQMETLERSVGLVEQHAETFSGVPELADGLAELRSSLEAVRQLYVAEWERQP
ncbi:hypothetical protein [Jiangella sp. DSM 45060]|uniref:hypothetical protein n=1 Tax=Jiangella sp. DSM 45060 TaxID=1798224 RepID=UPI00087A5F08|nr:hypothetical protein [Jiangella sp. DSM 45060]SDT70554.1 hypothetical protein SAMN04515669_6222 [Jiangella sp. DSM 45060]